jgi:hypothetical protein
MAKCYDMVPRQLAYEKLKWLGIPARILVAWSSYLERLRFYNAIGQTAGEVYEKPRALPQGDSWPTRALAAMLLAWAARLRKRGATPRYLADDMFARCTSRRNVEDPKECLMALTEAVVEETLDYIKNIRVDPQLHKCAILASTQEVRARLRKVKWGSKREDIPVVTDARDLGAHISSGNRAKSATLNIRVAENVADGQANRIHEVGHGEKGEGVEVKVHGNGIVRS